MTCMTSTGREQGKKLEAMVTVKEEEGEANEEAPMPVETKAVLGRAHRPKRTAAMQAKAHLDKYCKLQYLVRDPADMGTVPVPMLFGRKRPAADTQAPSWKRAQPAMPEGQMCPVKVEEPLFLADPEELPCLVES